MWACRICKGTVYLVLAVLLYFAIQALLTGGALGSIFSSLGATGAAGKSGFAAWTAFITWLATKVGVEGGDAIKDLGYSVFAGILTLGAAAVYAIADIVAWLVCLFCKLLGACDECEKPSIFK